MRGLAGVALLVALPFLPASYTERMTTITEYKADESASTRVAVWRWTMGICAGQSAGRRLRRLSRQQLHLRHAAHRGFGEHRDGGVRGGDRRRPRLSLGLFRGVGRAGLPRLPDLGDAAGAGSAAYGAYPPPV